MARKRKKHSSYFGSTDFFGLDEFGAADGKDGLIGIMIGGGVGTATALGLKAMKEPGKESFLSDHPETVGLLAGAAASAAYGMATKKHAAMWAGIAAALFTNGVRAVESLLKKDGSLGALSMYALPPAYPVAAGVGPGLSGLGIHSVENPAASVSGPLQTRAMAQLNGPSLGATKVSKPTLVGLDQAHGLAAAKQKVSLLGGPQIDGLAGAYGATLFGASR